MKASQIYLTFKTIDIMSTSIEITRIPSGFIKDSVGITL